MGPTALIEGSPDELDRPTFTGWYRPGAAYPWPHRRGRKWR
jgi:hypothetical protein